MEYLALFFLIVFLSGCSLEEYNRKKLAERAIEISEFKREMVSSPDAEIEHDNKVTIVRFSEEEVDIYFTNEGHPAHPSFVKHHFPDKNSDSRWFFASSAQRDKFTDWFVSFWNKKNLVSDDQICSLTKSKFKYKNACPLFSGDDWSYYKQSYMDLLIDSINECKCQKKTGDLDVTKYKEYHYQQLASSRRSIMSVALII